MTYRLMRVNRNKKGNIFGEITFDLWNHEYNVGYEIKLTTYKHCNENILKYLNSLIGRTYDISYWDKIIRDIKQDKIKL